MSEGTMQRAAESDQREPRVARTIRTRRPSRVLVGAAVVPVMLLAVGCSSESDSASDDDVPSEAVESALADSATPEVVEAAYASLPDACEVFSEKTLKSVVPQGVKSGKAINAAEENVTGDCRWISLDNNGVDGSQYRWLSVSLHLLASNAANGPGEDRAAKAYESKVTAAKAVDGAKNVKTEPVTGTGDQATAVLYDLKKDGDTFKQQTIVVRTENVVITLDYNGAGLAGEKTPDAAALLKTATSAAKEAVEAVEEANDTDASSSASPSKSASKTPSNGATKASSSGGSGADVSSDSDSDSDSSTSGRKKTSR
ncbi:hypothetical protein JIX56_18410 [Streptomyces sp. CA-210063]|uniref:hypothetical protein n=1 Tax=Streptomyces sp. CA-210063 TaxID=2801029 RepID=UPI00214B5942|nr:hypothetical protein [Streptomyces sp. CA-210063]UUU31721.1 hypothetical protein JIX56_18410 [Streptomyces sp. CA-210063]